MRFESKLVFQQCVNAVRRLTGFQPHMEQDIYAIIKQNSFTRCMFTEYRLWCSFEIGKCHSEVLQRDTKYHLTASSKAKPPSNPVDNVGPSCR